MVNKFRLNPTDLKITLLILDYGFVNRMLKNLSFKCHVNDVKLKLKFYI
jgi:hypothetical protein